MWNISINNHHLQYTNPEIVQSLRIAEDFVPRICRNCVYPWLSDTWSYPPASSKRCRRRRQGVRWRAALLSTSRIPNVASCRDASSPCIQIPTYSMSLTSWTARDVSPRLSGACSATRGHIHTEPTKNGRAAHDYYIWTKRGWPLSRSSLCILAVPSFSIGNLFRAYNPHNWRRLESRRRRRDRRL